MEVREILRHVPVFQRAEAMQGQLEATVLELAKAAFYDALTGLPNKTALAAAANAYVQRPEVKLGALFIDLAGFKELNDAHGHDAGDAALNRVGRDLAVLAKGHDAIAYRHGGDEFVVTATPEVLEELVTHANRLLNPIEFIFNDKPARVSATLGYALSEEGVLLTKLVERADAACRMAKSNNDGRPVKWTATIDLEAPEAFRRKCAACGATTVVQVAPSTRRGRSPTRCGNCDRDFDAQGAGPAAPGS